MKPSLEERLRQAEESRRRVDAALERQRWELDKLASALEHLNDTVAVIFYRQQELARAQGEIEARLDALPKGDKK